jgi:hypothetical protein
VAKVSVKNNESDVTTEAERMADLNEGEGGELFRAIEEARTTQGAEVILTRTMPADKAGFCDKIPVAEFDLTMLKNRYGPGTYRVRFNGPTGFLPGGSTIKVAATPEKPAAPQGDFQSFLEAQAQREAARSNKLWDLAMISVPALIAGLFNRPQQQSDLPALVAALKPTPGPTITDLTSALANMQQLSAPKSSETQVDTILKVFGAAQNLMGGKDSDGKTGDGSTWVDVIRDLIRAAPEAIKPMLEARMQAMTGQVTGVAQIPPTAALAPNPTGTTPQNSPIRATINTSGMSSVASVTNGGDSMRALWEPIAKQHLSKVFTWAEKQRDPQIYAEVFVDELPDLSAYLSIDQVLEHLQNPIWFEKVCELEPRLKSHKDFCTEMHAEVVEIVKQLKEDLQEDIQKDSKPDVPDMKPGFVEAGERNQDGGES